MAVLAPCKRGERRLSNRRVHGETVVVRGDLHLAGGTVKDRLVDTAVAVVQLVGAVAKGSTKQLVAEADTEER